MLVELLSTQLTVACAGRVVVNTADGCMLVELKDAAAELGDFRETGQILTEMLVANGDLLTLVRAP